MPADSAERPDEAGVRSLHRVFLWVNSGCNARCRMCDIWKEPPGRTLSVEEVDRWAATWRQQGVVRVVMCGEPLLHPELEALCSAIRGHGLRLDLLTNGLLLRRHAEAVAGLCDVLTVSLDGPPEVHDEIRGRRGAYARMRAGVAAVAAADPRLPVAARCAVHRLNAPRLRDTVAAAKAAGIGSISFSSVDLHNEEAFRRQGAITPGYVDDLVVRGPDLSALATELTALYEENAADFDSGYISDPPEHLDRALLRYYRALSGETEMPTPRCNAPWRSAVVEYDGTVRPCFPMPAYGNLFDADDLLSVVNNAVGRAHRAALDVATDPTCLGCVCPTMITDDVARRWDRDRDEPAIVAVR